MVSGIEGLIADLFGQTFGNNYYLIALISLFIWGAFVAVLRVPSLVAVLSTGMMLLLLFGQPVMDIAGTSYQVGGLGASGYVWFIVAIVIALALYFALKTTVWREY